jgi:hypothetical protein
MQGRKETVRGPRGATFLFWGPSVDATRPRRDYVVIMFVTFAPESLLAFGFTSFPFQHLCHIYYCRLAASVARPAL